MRMSGVVCLVYSTAAMRRLQVATASCRSIRLAALVAAGRFSCRSMPSPLFGCVSVSVPLSVLHPAMFCLTAHCDRCVCCTAITTKLLLLPSISV